MYTFISYLLLGCSHHFYKSFATYVDYIVYNSDNVRPIRIIIILIYTFIICFKLYKTYKDKDFTFNLYILDYIRPSRIRSIYTC